MLLFATTVFVSAFLLFQVQPIIGKFILPWFGGAPAVWTVCMLFFQLLLLAGYGWAHIVARRIPPRWQGVVHGLVVLAALAVLPIAPDESWKPTGAEIPTLRILGLLAVTVGLPFFALSATGPLLQDWFARVRRGSAPWWLYALSNGGSLLALLGYPFAVEWLLGVQAQTVFWSWGYGVFALLGVAVVLRVSLNARRQPATGGVANGMTEAAEVLGVVAGEQPHDARPGAATAGPSGGQRLMWVLLAAVASTMLLAVTNRLCLDVAVIPFLWVVPLCLYLMSFIFAFSGARLYHRGVWIGAFLVLAAGMTVMLFTVNGLSRVFGGEGALWVQVGVLSAGLFTCAMVCHGELYRSRPHPDHLTGFYLCVALGGAVGGVFVGVLAPLIFSQLWEYHVAIVATPVLVLLAVFLDPASALYRGRPMWAWAGLVAAVTTLGIALLAHAWDETGNTVAVRRNFFGTLRVTQYGGDETGFRRLIHGHINHGVQLRTPALRAEPTTYYCPPSGVGRALDVIGREGRRVGVIGLGAGTLAAYARPGDTFRFYDINPAVIELAGSHFTFLQDARDRGATIDVVLGDARLSMEREEAQQYDLLVLDAFSSDAIPTHLLTRECADVYLRHLRPGGVLALHVSNRYLDLVVVTLGIAEHLDMRVLQIHNGEQSDSEIAADTDLQWASATWMLLSRDGDVLAEPRLATAGSEPPGDMQRVYWTDDYTNLFGVLHTDD